MSSMEGVFSWQWLCMVTLFLASVVTLIIYLVLYFSNEPPAGKTPLSHVDSEEADGILCWVLSLKSWKSEWRRAWLRGLNEEARRSQSGIQLIFDEDGVQSSELALDHISSFTKTPSQKNVLCQVVGNKLQFSLCASPSSTSSETPLRYSVKISPLRLQPLSGGIHMAVAYFLAVSPAGQGRLLESSSLLLEWLCRLNNSVFRAFVSVLEVIAL